MAAAKQKPDGRGGKRAGAGRPKGYSPGREPLSVRQVKEMLEKAEAHAKKYGRTIDEILLDFVYGIAKIPIVDEETNILEVLEKVVGTRDRIACIKLWKEYTSPKITEGSEADKTVEPAVFLPDLHPRLELVSDGTNGK